MQFAGYVRIDDKTVKVLCRPYKTGVRLKVRHSGKAGRFLEGESKYLNLPTSSETVDRLLAGVVINL